MRNTIILNIDNRIPVGKSVVVFVQDPNGNWWPYLNVSQQSGTNSWKIQNVQFGQSGDDGMNFNIQAIIIDSYIKTEGIKIGDKVVYVCGGCELAMPVYAALRELYPDYTSAIITVIRK